MNVPPQPPSDPDIRKLIERTVQYVRRNGAEFEKMTKEKNAGNPRFGFLFPGHPLHPFYLFMCRFGSGGAPPPHTLQDPPTHLGSAPPATNMPHPSSGAGPHPGGHDPSAPQHPRMPPPFIHQVQLKQVTSASLKIPTMGENHLFNDETKTFKENLLSTTGLWISSAVSEHANADTSTGNASAIRQCTVSSRYASKL